MGVEDNVRKVGDCGAGFVQGGTLIQLLSPVLSLIPNDQHPRQMTLSCSMWLLTQSSTKKTVEVGAQFGIAGYTTRQMLYESQEFPSPYNPRPSKDVLVWTGTTAMGQYAIQLAALSGCRVLTTCSAKNFEFAQRRSSTQTQRRPGSSRRRQGTT